MRGEIRPPGLRQLKFHVSPRKCFRTYAVNLQKHSVISPPPDLLLLVPISTSGHSCLTRLANASRCAPTGPCSSATKGTLGLVVIVQSVPFVSTANIQGIFKKPNLSPSGAYAQWNSSHHRRASPFPVSSLTWLALNRHRHTFGSLPQRHVIQMDVPVRSGCPPIFEEASGDMPALAVHHHVRSVRMTQVVYSQRPQSGRYADRLPCLVQRERIPAPRCEHPWAVIATAQRGEHRAGWRRKPDRPGPVLLSDRQENLSN